MEVYATLHTKVQIDPIDVIIKLNIIPEGDWIIKNNSKYIHMEEVSAGQHSIDREVKQISYEKYQAWEAQQTLIKYLNKLK